MRDDCGMTCSVSGPSPKVIVGISGGVDSAVAALLLAQQGYRVEGMFMKNWDEDDNEEYCTAEADRDDARTVCSHLGIALHEANFAAEYWDNVFARFLAEYAAGRTPNPDVLCNREIKFNLFLDYARLLGADLIATGHYVRSSHADGEFRLLKGVDRDKEQSYFLQAVPREQLAPCLFPLGGMRKPEVRCTAREAGLPIHDKKDSTGICFIGERRFAEFLARYLPPKEGRIVDAKGEILGAHRGVAYYTLGQRQGLGIGGRANRPEVPWYVVSKDAKRNELVATQNQLDLMSRSLIANAMNWLAAVAPPFRCAAKTRYGQVDQACLVTRHGPGIRVDFEAPQRAIAPGQYVCLYDGDRCLGGGVIVEANTCAASATASVA